MLRTRLLTNNNENTSGWKVVSEGVKLKRLWAGFNEKLRCHIEFADNVCISAINAVPDIDLFGNHHIEFDSNGRALIATSDSKSENLIALKIVCDKGEFINNVKTKEVDVFTYSVSDDKDQLLIFSRFNDLENSNIKLFIQRQDGNVRVLTIKYDGYSQSDSFKPKFKHDTGIFINICKPQQERKLFVISPTEFLAVNPIPHENIILDLCSSESEIAEAIKVIPNNSYITIAFHVSPLATSMIIKKFFRTECSINILQNNRKDENEVITIK